MDEVDKKRSIRIYYDGECPFCSSYIRLVRLKEMFDVSIVDVRGMSRDALCEKFGDLDIDSGMIVTIDGTTTLYGDRAMTFLANCSTKQGAFNRINAAIFTRPRLAAALYPIMVTGRRAVLFILGRSKVMR
jgi:hypothetical protein